MVMGGKDIMNDINFKGINCLKGILSLTGFLFLISCNDIAEERGGDDVLAEVVVRVGVCFVPFQIFLQLAPFEDVNAHGCLIGLGNLGLFLEFGDAPFLVGGENAEAGRLLHGNLDDRHGGVCVCALVGFQHLGVVHGIDMVSRQDQNVVGLVLFNEVEVLVNGVCGALIPMGAVALLVGRQNVDPAVKTVQIPGCYQWW